MTSLKNIVLFLKNNGIYIFINNNNFDYKRIMYSGKYHGYGIINSDCIVDANHTGMLDLFLESWYEEFNIHNYVAKLFIESGYDARVHEVSVRILVFNID